MKARAALGESGCHLPNDIRTQAIYRGCPSPDAGMVRRRLPVAKKSHDPEPFGYSASHTQRKNPGAEANGANMGFRAFLFGKILGAGCWAVKKDNPLGNPSVGKCGNDKAPSRNLVRRRGPCSERALLSVRGSHILLEQCGVLSGSHPLDVLRAFSQGSLARGRVLTAVHQFALADGHWLGSSCSAGMRA